MNKNVLEWFLAVMRKKHINPLSSYIFDQQYSQGKTVFYSISQIQYKNWLK